MNDKALTLIEVLVALAILGITFTVLATSQLSSIRVTKESEETIQATTVMIDAYEQAKAQILYNYVIGYDADGNEIRSYNFETYNECPNTTLVMCSYEGTAEGGYRYSVDITGLKTSTDPMDEGLLRLDVAVTGPAPVSITTFVSCYDVYPTPFVNKPAPCPNVEPDGGAS